ncbi:hypothetical protein [Mesorhizobium sp. M0091]|uniref:hypothetical protein n=1 Tax=Mesorhizobium sp. M0091 TaxID=2956875 RepID=UPI00047C37DE
MMPENSVTGRDGYIIANALMYAICTIQNLPEDRQEWSDMNDMCKLVKHLCSRGMLEAFKLSVKGHTGKGVLTLDPEEELDKIN